MGRCSHDTTCGCLGWARLGRIAFPCEMPLTDRRRLIDQVRRAVIGMAQGERASFLTMAFGAVPIDVLAECTGETPAALYRATTDARARRREWIAHT
jgi:hypothetical protein